MEGPPVDGSDRADDFLKPVGYQEARRVPDRGRLGQSILLSGPIVPAGADQVELPGLDQLTAGPGGGGPGGIELRSGRLEPDRRFHGIYDSAILRTC